MHTAPTPHHPTFSAADGTPLAYWEWLVPDGTPARATVVFLHGWGDYGGRSAALAALLNARGVQCFAPDFRGHGRSPGPRAQVHDFDVLVADLRAFLDAASLRGPLFLCGHSMGGCLAAHYAIRYPAGLGGLVFCSGALAIHPSVSRLKRHLSRLLGSAWPSLPLGTLKTPAHMARDTRAQAEYAADRQVHQGGIDAGTGLALLRAHGWLERYGEQLEVPFLALQGGADELVAVDGPVRLREATRGAGSTVLYPGARHDLVLDLGAARVARDITSWLEPRIAQTESHTTPA